MEWELWKKLVQVVYLYETKKAALILLSWIVHRDLTYVDYLLMMMMKDLNLGQ